MKVALVYDRVNKWGGAERVLLALHELFPDAPLYTSLYNPKTAGWAKVFEVRTSFLQQFPFAKSHHELFPYLMPLAFEGFSFDEYHLVISVTSEAAKGIVTKPSTAHLCYCLTPTRYLWSGHASYFPSFITKAFASPLLAYLRKWDLAASKRPDKFVAISKEVQKRITTYYDRASDVIYPPLALNDSVLEKESSVKDLSSSPYFLVVSRLVPYKRVDLVVKACKQLNAKLKIIGTGSEEKKLKHLAGANVQFLGSLTDNELVRYYKGCRALLFAGHEDLGLAIVEAQSFGKPVVAYGYGGAGEIVTHEKTGVLFYSQTKEAMISAIRRLDHLRINKELCKQQARMFEKKRFKKTFMEAVDSVVKEKAYR